MQLRQADKADIPQLISMRIAYLSEDYGGLSEDQAKTITAQLSEYFRDHLNRELIVFVCEDNKKIVSTVFLLITEKPANPSFLSGLSGTIMNVYTLPQYRRKGIAGSLIKMAMHEAEFQKLSYIDLKATKSGFSLYKKLGFTANESKYVSMIYHINQDKYRGN